MNKHKRLGSTVIELMVVIVVVAILATITTLSYREVQKDARNEKRKADVVMLRSAVEEYYADKGDYPRVTCTEGSGGTNECQRNEVWQVLKDSGYLKKIPYPEAPSYSTSHNVAPNGNAYYIFLYSSPTRYGIYAPLEGSNGCKTGKNVYPTWWDSMPECDF